MKKYVLLTAATIAAVSWVLLTPLLTALGVTDVSVRKTAMARASTTVDCSGILQTASQQTVVYGYPVMAEKVYVHTGDTVTKGQALMEVDRSETAAAFAAISAAQSASASSGSDAGAASSDSTDSDSDAAETAALQQYLNGQGGDLNSLISEYYGSDASDSDSTDSSDGGDAADAASEDSSSRGDSPTVNVPDTICAAISGVVTKVNAAEGTFTQPTVPLVVISDDSQMQVKSQVDESQISAVKAGQKVHVSGGAFTGTYDGEVAQIAPTAHTVVTGTTSTKTVVDVTINLKTADPQLKAGMSADTSILISNDDEISLPYEAIRQDNNNRLYVLVLQNGKACRRDITTGTEHTDDVAVRSGLKTGELVILNPPQSLSSGMPVRVVSYG